MAAPSYCEPLTRRIHEIRYSLALTFLAARLGVWLVGIGLPETASIVEGWLDTHLPTPYPSIQSTVEELHQRLGQGFPAHDKRAPP